MSLRTGSTTSSMIIEMAFLSLSSSRERTSDCICRTSVRSLSTSAAALRRDKRGMFRFNPGKQGQAFPDYNPYTRSDCHNCTRKLDLARGIPANQLCEACLLVRKCEELRFEQIKDYENGGRILVHHLVGKNDSDYSKLLEIAEHFASQGREVKLTPKMSRPKKFLYENIYSSLMGTKYENKCPDLFIDGLWYEHEGFVSNNPKRAFSNMMFHGLKQSSRLIIDKPELKDGYMLRSIYGRIRENQIIDEIWLNDNGQIRLLYKKDRQ